MRGLVLISLLQPSAAFCSHLFLTPRVHPKSKYVKVLWYGIIKCVDHTVPKLLANFDKKGIEPVLAGETKIL